jgi:hypothetical protein
VDGLAGVTSLSTLSVFGNPALLDLDGLSGVLAVVEDIGVGYSGVRNLDGLDGITGRLQGSLSVYNNPHLVQLDGLITAIAGRLTVENNPSLLDISGLGRSPASTKPCRFSATPACASPPSTA